MLVQLCGQHIDCLRAHGAADQDFGGRPEGKRANQRQGQKEE